jgi:hypothetical protein
MPQMTIRFVAIGSGSMELTARILFDCYLALSAAFVVLNLISIHKNWKRHLGFGFAGLGFIFRVPMSKYSTPANISIEATLIAMAMIAVSWLCIVRLPEQVNGGKSKDTRK